MHECTGCVGIPWHVQPCPINCCVSLAARRLALSASARSALTALVSAWSASASSLLCGSRCTWGCVCWRRNRASWRRAFHLNPPARRIIMEAGGASCKPAASSTTKRHRSAESTLLWCTVPPALLCFWTLITGALAHCKVQTPLTTWIGCRAHGLIWETSMHSSSISSNAAPPPWPLQSTPEQTTMRVWSLTAAGDGTGEAAVNGRRRSCSCLRSKLPLAICHVIREHEKQCDGRARIADAMSSRAEHRTDENRHACGGGV